MSDPEHKAKMATRPGAPAGVEMDARGEPIPFEKRTEGDQEKIRGSIAAAVHGGASIKNPENEAEIPAPMHDPGQDGAGPKKDPAGQQGKSHR